MPEFVICLQVGIINSCTIKQKALLFFFFFPTLEYFSKNHGSVRFLLEVVSFFLYFFPVEFGREFNMAAYASCISSAIIVLISQ